MNRQTVLRWSGYVAFAIVFAIACGFLSHWQFERGAERDAQLELIAANYDAEPVPLDRLIPAGGVFDGADQWHPVVVTGEYLTEHQLLARNRPRGGTSAFEVLVPFRTDDGRVFIVNRGWVPPGADQPEPDSVPAAPEGPVTVVARLMPDEPAPRSGRTAPPGQVPTVTTDIIAETLPGERVVDGVYGIMVSETPAPSARPSELPSPSEDPGPHLSYAIQWILFAIMGFAFIWYMIRTELKHRREDAEDAAARASGAPAPPPRPKRRRDRDAEEEDALVDAR
ncbi:SURF1 family cytochrome oxidase biogenesis protein [Microbacterium sp. No. 7]|uniref:SURF1 family cytochrome oxidase biogenesis protein n=1 Tax=Microbacterium sp. No. 7 TaxID=1714373 RepID=UPI0006D15B30|nr:SURF1 family protein [Microbacterium sp. No. 7]ALJ20711.1 hypothetical protein AOA12_12700 [Microbacterium sp. No. 7]